MKKICSKCLEEINDLYSVSISNQSGISHYHHICYKELDLESNKKIKVLNISEKEQQDLYEFIVKDDTGVLKNLIKKLLK